MDTAVFLNGKIFSKVQFHKEDDFEKIIYDNSKLLFGSKTILIEKRMIKTINLGHSIPDGFLFDFNDINNPQFYLIEVELSSHRFYEHIFPQLTKFIAFFKSPESRKNLIEKLFDFVGKNKDIHNQFKRLLGEKEIFKAISDGVENSQNILLILDEAKAEVDETKRAYAEWAKLVRVEIAGLYKHAHDQIFTLTPPFERVELESPDDKDDATYDEYFHLESSNDEIKSAYNVIKNKMLQFDKDLKVNPQRYYISLAHSRNFAYIQPRKSKLHIVITLPFNVGRKAIKHHKISKLSNGVQKFYNTKCFRLTIEDTKKMNEVIQLLKNNYKRTLVE